MTTLPNKKVSVIVPNYNYAKYIKRRIESILQQTYPIYELIILDDASTDESIKKIEKVLKRHNLEFEKHATVNTKEGEKDTSKNQKFKVKLIANNNNSGKAILQWKKGFEMASGDYVWIAEADDSCSKRFLEETMKGFDDPEVVLSYTESKIINGMGIMIAPNFRWSRDKEKTGHYKRSYIKNGHQEIKEIMAIRCTIPNVSAVVLKNDRKLLGYLDEALKFSQVGDWYFYAKVLDNGKIAYSKKALNKFRIHSGSKTDESKKNKKHYEEVLEMHNYFMNMYDLVEGVKKAMKNEEMRIRLKHDIIGESKREFL